MKPIHTMKTAMTMRISACLLLAALFATAPASAQVAPQGSSGPTIPEQVVTKLSRDGALRYHFPVYYADGVARLEPLGEQSVRALRRELGLEGGQIIDVWLTERLDDYFVWHHQPSAAPSWAVGLSLTNRRTVLLRQALGQGGTVEELRRTFKHELAHVAIDEARSGGFVPRWLHEGYAQHHAQEWTLERGEQVSRMAASGQLIPLRYLETSFPSHQDAVSLAYSQSLHFVRHLTRLYGEDVFGRALALVRQGVPFHVAMAQVTGQTMEELEAQWRRGLTERTTPWSNLADGSFLLVPGVLLFLYGWRRRRSERADKFARLDDGVGQWGYDPQRYKLPSGLYDRR
jgi:hypothetical protein